jgi:hypothetical protein
VIEARIARITNAQQGAIDRDQVLAAGWSDSHIRTRVRRREWRREHQGVYIAGDPDLMPLARHSAALLALGPNAALNHRTGVELWGLIRQGENVPIHVTLPARSAQPRRGLRIHLVRTLDAKDIRRRHNLRVTSPARSLIDFATQAASNELLHALSQAVAHNLTTENELNDALTASPPTTPARRSSKPSSPTKPTSSTPARSPSATSSR